MGFIRTSNHIHIKNKHMMNNTLLKLSLVVLYEKIGDKFAMVT
jgi:hypothetical protein